MIRAEPSLREDISLAEYLCVDGVYGISAQSMSIRFARIYSKLFQFCHILSCRITLKKRSIMSGRGKELQAKRKAKSRSSRTRLQIPVRRIRRLTIKGNYAERFGAGAPVYLAAVLEYSAAKVLEMAGNAARDNKKTRIIPLQLLLAIRNDEELNKLFSGVTIAQGGFLLNIQAVLLPKKSTKTAAK